MRVLSVVKLLILWRIDTKKYTLLAHQIDFILYNSRTSFQGPPMFRKKFEHKIEISGKYNVNGT